MTLQSSGPISLLDIQNEFGGANPISLSEYYNAASGVPASGTISLSDFYGKSAVTNFNTGIIVGTNEVYNNFQHLTNSSQYSFSIGHSIQAYGYDGGADPYSSASFGSIPSGASYRDGNGVTQTISSIYCTRDSQGGTTAFYFTLAGSVANADAAFKSIVANGNTFTRATASYSSVTGGTTWSWNANGTNVFGTATGTSMSVKVVLV